eukprot:TRINITY_DN28250_c0_g1_i1.p1 TRINITY_DN28250_c0_g1~~TRINITY_DN28250_c0_g1_i1.p1  ORF type:complete len:176 (+),score=23.92 TRINITY_DN28250_c0_g1_i1:419-946(+)
MRDLVRRNRFSSDCNFLTNWMIWAVSMLNETQQVLSVSVFEKALQLVALPDNTTLIQDLSLAEIVVLAAVCMAPAAEVLTCNSVVAACSRQIMLQTVWLPQISREDLQLAFARLQVKGLLRWCGKRTSGGGGGVVCVGWVSDVVELAMPPAACQQLLTQLGACPDGIRAWLRHSC